MPPIRPPRSLPGLIAALLLMALAACSSPSVLVRQWTLDYPPPPPAAGEPLAANLKVERFTTAYAYASTEMFYAETGQERSGYDYHRWLAAPGDLVGDLILRDLRAAGRLKGVFSARESARARFRLEGGVVSILEQPAPSGPQGFAGPVAHLAVTVVLLDRDQRDTSRRVLMQKDYQVEEPLQGRGAPALAAAMSRATQAVSARITRDVTQALAAALTP